MNIVLDTNCLLVALPLQSSYYWLWQAFHNKRFTLCYTTDILQEYREVLANYYSLPFADLVIDELLNAANKRQTTVYFKWHLITVDPDDNKFVDCAITAGAQYVVTNDKHFNVLHKIDFPKVQIANISTFKQIITRIM
jgi:putative PIN family toxin of toxin-antitoxin system